MSKNNQKQVLDNVTPIGAARSKKSRAEQVPSGADGQIHEQVPECEIGAKERQKTGADGTGTGIGTEIVESDTKQVRTRGKDKVPRKKRTDSNQLAFPADDRARILAHNLNVMKLGRIKDKNDLEEVQGRISFYIESCIQHEVLPTVAGLALCLGIDRGTLWDWIDGRRGTVKNPDVVDTLKGVYMQINCQYEDLLTQGKITPVAGFFLMQNNFGYKNTTDHVIVAQQAEEPDTQDIASRAGLLEDSHD